MTDNLATKDDLAAAIAPLATKDELAAVKADIVGVKADIALVRSEIQQMGQKMTIRLGTMVGGSLAIMLALLKLFDLLKVGS